MGSSSYVSLAKRTAEQAAQQHTAQCADPGIACQRTCARRATDQLVVTEPEHRANNAADDVIHDHSPAHLHSWLKHTTIVLRLRHSLTRVLPSLAQRGMQPVAKLDRQLVRLTVLVERDGLADVVHDDLTRIAARQMFLKLLANGWVD